MNTQQALRKCFNYFMDMNHEPGYRDDKCVYYANGSDPVRCAVGCLIPARFQERAGKCKGGVTSLLEDVPELETVFVGVDKRTLGDMQFAHDSWAGYGYNDTRETFLDDLQTLMCFHDEEAA